MSTTGARKSVMVAPSDLTCRRGPPAASRDERRDRPLHPHVLLAPAVERRRPRARVRGGAPVLALEPAPRRRGSRARPRGVRVQRRRACPTACRRIRRIVLGQSLAQFADAGFDDRAAGRSCARAVGGGRCAGTAAQTLAVFIASALRHRRSRPDRDRVSDRVEQAARAAASPRGSRTSPTTPRSPRRSAPTTAGVARLRGALGPRSNDDPRAT